MALSAHKVCDPYYDVFQNIYERLRARFIREAIIHYYR